LVGADGIEPPTFAL